MAKRETARIVHGYIRIRSNNDNGENCPTTNPLITEFAMGMFTATGFSGWLYMLDVDNRWGEVYMSSGKPSDMDRETLDSKSLDLFFARELRAEFARLIVVPYNRETDEESPYIARNTSDFYGDTILYLSEESKSMIFPMDEVRAKFLRDDNERAIKKSFMEEYFSPGDKGEVPDYDAYISGAVDGQLCEEHEALTIYDLKRLFGKYGAGILISDALKVERLSKFIKAGFPAVSDNEIEKIINEALT